MLLGGAAVAVLVWPHATRAQQLGKSPTIGILLGATTATIRDTQPPRRDGGPHGVRLSNWPEPRQGITRRGRRRPRTPRGT